MTIVAVTVDKFDEDAIDLLGAEGDRVVASEGFVSPVKVSLHAKNGEQIAHSQPDNTMLLGVETERAWMLSQDGAWLELTDANGRRAEVLLVIRRRIQ